MELGAGLIMDTVLLGIILFSTILGTRKGFARTVASFMQWFLCIFLGFLFCEKMKGLLHDYTQLEETLCNLIAGHIETSIEESSAYEALPDLFRSWLEDGTESASFATAETITDSLLTVIAFLSVVFGIKLLTFLLVQAFSRKYNDGITGFIDGFLGFLFGLSRGLLLALLFFAVLVPILTVIWPRLSELIVNSISSSYIAKLFYDENVLLILIRDIFV